MVEEPSTGGTGKTGSSNQGAPKAGLCQNQRIFSFLLAEFGSNYGC